uniref:Secreted protein n=1 Tax=Anguilla anguilla TaxID=7936 RepID=A0A0E9X1S3_ANGAN
MGTFYLFVAVVVIKTGISLKPVLNSFKYNYLNGTVRECRYFCYIQNSISLAILDPRLLSVIPSVHTTSDLFFFCFF